MKIKLSYTPEERWIAYGISAFVRNLCPGTKVRESDKHPPRKITYLTVKAPEILTAPTDSEKPEGLD